jgi:hypothetical protein
MYEPAGLKGTRLAGNRRPSDRAMSSAGGGGLALCRVATREDSRDRAPNMILRVMADLSQMRAHP